MTDNNFIPGEPEHGGQILTPEDVLAMEENNRLIQEHNLRRAERVNAAMAAQAHAQRQAAAQNGQQEPQESQELETAKEGPEPHTEATQPQPARLHAIAPPPEDNALIEWFRGGTFWLALGLFGGVAIAYLMVSRAEDEESQDEGAKSS